MSVVNAAAMVDDLGLQDISGTQVAIASKPTPQHIPKFWVWAQKGDTSEQLLVGAEREMFYGDQTFVEGSPYFNHATIFANEANENANAAIYKRLIPADAGPKANLTLWLDVLSTTVDLYERNSDGSIKTNELGDPTVVGTTQGYRVKWVATSSDVSPNNPGEVEPFRPGMQTQRVGNQTDGVRTSTRYPIMDFQVYSQGVYGNDLGIRIWTPNVEVDNIPYKMMETFKAFPYYFAVVNRSAPLYSAEVVKTLFGEQSLMTVLKPSVKDPLTGNNLSLGSIVTSAYGNMTDPRYPLELPPFGGFHLYQSNVDLLTGLFHAAEIPFIDNFSDFTSYAEDAGLFNFVTGQSTYGVPYHSFVFSNTSDSVSFSQYTDVQMAGGSDGTMNDEIFAEMVELELKRYRDRKDELMDLAFHVESIFYDSGFPRKTKLVMPSFISQRHDTFLVAGTHTFGEAALTASEEYSMAVALRTRIMSYPDSAYFGTPATRAMIMGCSGRVRNTEYRVPATFEILSKFSAYMGASDGKWKSTEKPDGDPGSIIEKLVDINMVFVPDSVKNRYWDVGLNWIQRFDRERFFIPAYRTVFPDDTSVMTSAITALGYCTLNKIGHAAWRSYSGVSYLTNLQLCERVNDFVSSRTKDIFDNRFVIVPRATVTDLNKARGFQWTLPIGLGAAGMKTVQTLYVQADRVERLLGE